MHSITGGIQLADDYSINIDKLFEEALKEVYGKALVEESKKTLSPSLFKVTNEPLQHAVDSVFAAPELGKPEQGFLDQFKYNTGVFAAFKAHAEQKLLVSLLLDEKGNLRSFREFRKAVKAVNIQWNEQWLRTEYNTAARSARAAANYQDALRSKDTYPNLEYLVSNARDKREEHLDLVGTILPIEHSFWDIYLPPSEWNCKCSFRPTDKPATGVPKITQMVPPTFQNNPGKTAEFVKLNEHPYLKGKGVATCPECRRQGLVDRKMDNADPFIDRGSDYCITHRFVYLANLKSFAKQAIDSLIKNKRHLNGSVIIGQLDNHIRKNIKERDKKLHRTDATTNAHAIYKYIDHAKEEKGALLPFEDVDYVLKAILEPEKIYLQTKGKGTDCYIMTTPYKDGKIVKVVVHINYEKKNKVYNYVKSWGVVEESSINNGEVERIK